MPVRNPIIKFAVFALAILTVAAGLGMIAAAPVLLGRLDDHMGEHAADYYDLARQYGALSSIGVRVCLVGCIGLGVRVKSSSGFHAGAWSAAVGFGTAIFGAFLFPIHSASGAVYFSLLAVTFGASLTFVSIATIRYIWGRSLA